MRKFIKKVVFIGCCFAGIIKLQAQLPVLGIPKGHLAEVYFPDFSPDGRLIVTPSADKTAKVWELLTGRLLFSLEGHTKQVIFAKFTKDNKNVITAGDNSIIIWDALTGKKKVHMLHGEIPGIDINNLQRQVINSSSLTAIALSKDGKYMASGATDSTIIIWDIEKGKQFRQLNNPGKLKSVVFTSNSGHLISLSENYVVGYWDIKTGKFIKQLIPDAKNTANLNISPDGNKILTMTDTDASAYVWDLASGKMLNHFSEENRLMSVNWSPGGSKVIGAGNSQSYIWDVATGKLEYPLAGHQGWVYNAVFSPSEKTIATSGRDLTIKIWNPLNKKLLHSLEGHQGMINSLSFSPDGKMVVSTSDDHSVKFWNLETGQMARQLSGATKEAFFGKISTDKNYFLTASADNNCIVWNLQGAKKMHSLAGHTSWIYFADFSKNNKLIVTAATDKTARIWKLETGELLQVLNGHKDVVNHANFNKEATMVVTASEDKTAILWNVANGKIVQVFNHTQQVKTAEFSPDGKHILTTSFDRTAKIWDVQSGKLLASLNKHTWIIRAGEYSSDGRYIATASGDETAILWNAVNGDYIKTFKGHKGFVYKASFNSTNSLLYTASLDSTIKIWDIGTGTLLHTMPLNGASVKSIFTTQSKTYIVTAKDAIFQLNDSALNISSSIFLRDSLCLVFTAGGNYMGDKEMVKLLYYIKSIKTLGYDQLDVKYNRPDKVLEVLGSNDTTLIKSYRKAWEKRIKKLGIDTTAFRDGYSVPEADFANRDAIEYEIKNEKLTLRIKGNDNTYKLDRFNIWVNEAPVYGQRGISLRNKLSNNFDSSITIKLSQGTNSIETSVRNVNGIESYRIPLIVNYTPAIKQIEKVHFIGIGIDKFAEHKYNLQYSAKDIRDLAKKMKEKYGNDIVIDTLFNENVTLNNVKALKKKLLQTSENDKVMIAYSGHGMLSKDFDYYLSTYAVNFEKPEQKGLPYDELENLLDSIPARKKLLLIDACHSGEVDKEELEKLETNMAAAAAEMNGAKGVRPLFNPGSKKLGMQNSFELMQSLFVNVGRSTGATVISAAGGTQFALERGDLKNGVFTYSILEFMKEHPTATIAALKAYVNKRVPELTRGMQVPTSRTETNTVDWNVW